MIIPFFLTHAGCPHRCVFCDQKRITGAPERPGPAAVAGTIASHLAAGTAAPAEVAFFGGSFTALPQIEQHAYLDAVLPFILDGTVSSIRISTRPDGISPERAVFLRQRHVATVELGVQSMDDAVLRLAGRGHLAQDTVQAVAVLREQGCSVGLQLMPGLPGDSAEIFLRTVERVIGLRPDFVRIYPALVIRGTPLEILYREGRFTPLGLADAIELCVRAVDRFETAGIEVLRLGLQSTPALERPGEIAAGPYHPAFGQLVASRRMLRRMRTSALTGGPPGREAVLLVNPADLSTAIGQHRENVLVLVHELRPVPVRVLADAAVPRGSVRRKAEHAR